MIEAAVVQAILDFLSAQLPSGTGIYHVEAILVLLVLLLYGWKLKK
jgi:hypothetical protein